MKPSFNVDPESSEIKSSEPNASHQHTGSPSTKTEPEDWSTKSVWGGNSSSPNGGSGSNSSSSSPVEMEPHPGNPTPVSWSSTPPTATVPYSGGYPSQESPTPPSSIAPQGTEIPFVAPPDLNPDPTQAKIKAQAQELKKLKQSMETPHSQESEGAGNLLPTSGPITK